MDFLKSLIFLFFLLFFYSTYAQQSIVQKDLQIVYLNGLELIQNSKYSAAKKLFENYLNNYPHSNKAVEAKYYIALSSLFLFNPDAENLFNDFVEDYPYHTLAKEAYYEMGTFYYNQKNYDKTIQILEKAQLDQLTQSKQLEGHFRLGYSYFTKKEFDKALIHFNQIKSNPTKYQAAANYYAAYIEYKNEKFDEALNDLKVAETDNNYKNLAPAMAASIYYKKGDYKKVINYVEPLLKSADKTMPGLEDLLLLSGESYFKLEDYKRATDSYKKYLNLRSKPSTDIQYRIGYSFYKMDDWVSAANNFKVVAAVKDSSGQAASYLLGLSYLKINNKEFAYSAFQQASETSFNKTIKKEAHFYQAKLAFDLERYADGVDLLKLYLKEYNNGYHEDEAQELLSESLINSNNPSEALEYIEGIKNKTFRIKNAYQKIAFRKGVELFNQNKFEESISLFDKSISTGSDKELINEATFWKGEANSANKNYEKAIQNYFHTIQVGGDSPYFLKSKYGIGYAYYNTKEYDKALINFKDYVTKLKDQKVRPFYNDAELRLADLYYVTKQYDEALQYYSQIITNKSSEVDYAYFQKGVVLGLSNKYNQAIEMFDVVINRHPTSLYFDNALFQKAEFELELSNYENAVKGFTKLILLHPNSGFVPYSLLKRGIAFSNLQKHAEATKDYKEILDKYSNHVVAQNALLGLQEAIAASGNKENMNDVLTKFKNSNPQSDALVKIEFENAKLMYNDQKYTQSIEAFNNYIKSYPESPNMNEVQYYLAESYYRTKDSKNSIVSFKTVTQDSTSIYFNRAIQRLADLEFANQSYENALNYYKQLSKISKNKKERFTSWTGLMECYYHLKNFDSSAIYVSEILNSGNATIDAENKAFLYEGKISMSRGQIDKAMDLFINTFNTAKDENGVEAQYLLAEIQYNKKLYKQSLETLYDLNNNFTAYDLWIGKSFLLIAENFNGLNEVFQAKATLQSIIEKSSSIQAVEKAKIKLKELESTESAKSAE